MTEVELLFKYSFDEAKVKACQMVHALYTAAEGTFEVLDFDLLKVKVNEYIDYLTLYKRYHQLNKQAKDQLSWMKSPPKFTLAGHEFDNLDEVERALKHKAFL